MWSLVCKVCDDDDDDDAAYEQLEHTCSALVRTERAVCERTVGGVSTHTSKDFISS